MTDTPNNAGQAPRQYDYRSKTMGVESQKREKLLDDVRGNGPRDENFDKSKQIFEASPIGKM